MMANDNDHQKSKIGYIFDNNLLIASCKIPPIRGRALFIHKLIEAFELLQQNNCQIIPVKPVNDDILKKFHTIEYLNFVKSISCQQKTQVNNNNNNSNAISDEDYETFGLAYDCPTFDNIYLTIAYIVSSTLTAAKAIISKEFQIVINWFGGWHHGQKGEASGFCYTNDIIFGIEHFLENNYNKILYIDMDLHHGNGVENHFWNTDKVVTLSLHKYEFGFFPGTGSIDDIGWDDGKFYTINFPFDEGLNDNQYIYVFEKIINKLIPKYQPQVIICQCGADTLSGDRMMSFNLTPKTYEYCLEKLLSYHIPLIILGGGGYNYTNTAKLWTLIQAKVLGKILDPDIPDHDLFLYYGPGYDLTIMETMITNRNDPKIIDENLEKVLKNIENIR